MSQPDLVICMGVSGSGKSTLAQDLAAYLQVEFFDADDLHTAQSQQKMAAGQGLNNEERDAWMQRVEQRLRATAGRGASCVMAHSALRARHRQRLRECDMQTLFVYLDVPPAVIKARLAQRQGHFANAALLPSQLATLETPEQEADVHTVDASSSFDVVRRTARRLVKHLRTSVRE